MPNVPNIITVRTSSGVYEIVESEDGHHVTLREAGNRERQLKFESSAIPAIVTALRKLDPKAAQREVPRKHFKSY
jgi:hypothetical protein